jgi:hypothetical protein
LRHSRWLVPLFVLLPMISILAAAHPAEAHGLDAADHLVAIGPLSQTTTCDVASANGPVIQLPQLALATCTMTFSPAPTTDGSVILTLVTNTTGQTGLPAILGCPAACQVQAGGTQLQLACGVTAPSGTVPSSTCTSVTFTIQNPIWACITNPTTLCPQGANLNSTSATLTVAFLATPGNGGSAGGGISLGTLNFAFQGAPTGTLLVTASPALIPSNGTLGSVISATFSCADNSQIGTVNGFPISNGATLQNSVFPVPVLATNETAVCGLGLPGNFAFSAPHNILFDNGRSAEEIACGPGPNVNQFGGANLFPLLGSTAPLTFTCQGASVMAIGNGAAGSAPINVVYTSAVGGITAVGSTFLVVAPSGTPVVSMSCNPTTIEAGGAGSLCTVSVTDINGVPLSGFTGATVTFTSSNPAVSVGACNYSLSPLTNFQTQLSPIGNPVLSQTPALGPYPPCVIPSSTVPSQVTTFLNGTATALVTAGQNAGAGPVTVSASVGTMLPPNFLCSMAPYLPSSGFPNTSTPGSPTVVGCGSASPAGFAGSAATLSTATSAVLASGTVTLPNAPSAGVTLQVTQATQIDIVGATRAHPIVLSPGCSQVIVRSFPGSPIKQIAAIVDPQAPLVSIWRYNNALGRWQSGFFADQSAPTDISATGGPGGSVTPTPVNATTPQLTQVTETYMVCVKGVARI